MEKVPLKKNDRLPKIIWTRSIADWTDDLSHLTPLVEHVLHLPCIHIESTDDPLPSKSIALGELGLVTSANALKFATTDVLKWLKACSRIYTLGPQTAAILTQQGMHAIVPEDVNSAESLSKWIKDHLQAGSRLLWPRGQETTVDFVTSLAPAGILVSPIVVYRTIAKLTDHRGFELKEEKLATLKSNLYASGWVVCFASPSAVKGFVHGLVGSLSGNNSDAQALFDQTTACCIGSTTAQAAASFFTNIVTARNPSVPSLVASAQKIYDRF